MLSAAAIITFRLRLFPKTNKDVQRKRPCPIAERLQNLQTQGRYQWLLF